MMRRIDPLDRSMRLCFIILCFFMVTVLTRFFTRRVFVEKLAWDNLFTRIVFWGDETLGKPDEKTEVAIDWKARYPFVNVEQDTLREEETLSDRIRSRVTALESKISAYTWDLLFGHQQLTRIGKLYNSAIGCTEIPMNGDRDPIIILNNGHIAYRQPAVSQEEIATIARNITDFSEYLDKQGIFFVYANAGSVVCPTDKQLPEGAEEYTNENADALLAVLEENGVHVLDYRVPQMAHYGNWYDSYYITDYHWKNTTALWAAGEMAKYLNENAGFHFDLQCFDEDQYAIEERPDYFLGGGGRVLTTALVEKEPFCRILPRFATDLSIRIPTRNINLRGAYEETLFRKEFFDSIARYSNSEHETYADAYHSVMWRSDALGEIKNHATKNNADKRILILPDSFGWFLFTYLALDIGETDLIHPVHFTGSIRSYIEENKPNAVVFLICEQNIDPIDEENYRNHMSYFDFR